MAKRKYCVNVIYGDTEEGAALLDTICENHARSRSSMLRHLVREEYRSMKKQEKADARSDAG